MDSGDGAVDYARSNPFLSTHCVSCTSGGREALAELEVSTGFWDFYRCKKCGKWTRRHSRAGYLITQVDDAHVIEFLEWHYHSENEHALAISSTKNFLQALYEKLSS